MKSRDYTGESGGSVETAARSPFCSSSMWQLEFSSEVGNCYRGGAPRFVDAFTDRRACDFLVRRQALCNYGLRVVSGKQVRYIVEIPWTLFFIFLCHHFSWCASESVYSIKDREIGSSGCSLSLRARERVNSDSQVHTF